MEYLHSISGTRTLTGQHCAPLVGDTHLVNVHRMLKHYPALFGQDFGFSAPGTWDGINFHFWQEREAYQALYDSTTTITLENLPWAKVDQSRIHHPVLK